MTNSIQTGKTSTRPGSSRALLLGGVAMLVAGAVAAQAATAVSSRTRVSGFLSATLAGLMASKGIAVTPKPTPAPAPAPSAAEIARMGVNLAPATYYGSVRAYANLATGASWGSSLSEDGQLDPSRRNADGMPRQLAAGERSMYILTPPEAVLQAGGSGARILCTYEGDGTLEIGGGSHRREASPGRISFFWPSTDNRSRVSEEDVRVWLMLTATNPSNPIRNVDCREADMDRSQTFTPAYVDYVRRFGIVRFMDWQNTNQNVSVTWATRKRAGANNAFADDGAPVEDMVALANQAGVQPWFNMSWNASDDYIRGFAEHVRDNLRPDLLVYVENSNEVWNWGFPVAHQASREGLAMGLADNIGRAMVNRYADRTRHVMKIWTEVFRDNPRRIVRVAGSQSAYRAIADEILSFQDTAQWVDALAIAPYFGHEMFEGAHAGTRDVGDMFARMPAMIDATIDDAVANKATADRYGKKILAYEGGQHIVSQDIELMQRVQRDPRMYDMYQRYLNGWYTRVSPSGMVLFNDTFPISRHGSWGLREYAWQPVADAPKIRAVFDFLNNRPR